MKGISKDLQELVRGIYAKIINAEAHHSMAVRIGRHGLALKRSDEYGLMFSLIDRAAIGAAILGVTSIFDKKKRCEQYSIHKALSLLRSDPDQPVRKRTRARYLQELGLDATRTWTNKELSQGLVERIEKALLEPVVVEAHKRLRTIRDKVVAHAEVRLQLLTFRRDDFDIAMQPARLFVLLAWQMYFGEDLDLTEFANEVDVRLEELFVQIGIEMDPERGTSIVPANKGRGTP